MKNCIFKLQKISQYTLNLPFRNFDRDMQKYSEKVIFPIHAGFLLLKYCQYVVRLIPATPLLQ